MPHGIRGMPEVVNNDVQVGLADDSHSVALVAPMGLNGNRFPPGLTGIQVGKSNDALQKALVRAG